MTDNKARRMFFDGKVWTWNPNGTHMLVPVEEWKRLREALGQIAGGDGEFMGLTVAECANIASRELEVEGE